MAKNRTRKRSAESTKQPREEREDLTAYDEADTDLMASIGSALAAESPRGRLRSAADGEAPLNVEDIEALLTDHVLDADSHAKELSKTCSQLVEFMFSDQKADPTATISLIKDLSSLSRANSEEMRKSIELLSRIRRQPPPRVQVVSVDGQVNIGERQANAATVKLGDR